MKCLGYTVRRERGLIWNSALPGFSGQFVRMFSGTTREQTQQSNWVTSGITYLESIMVVGHRACVVYSFITPFLFSVCSFVLQTSAVCCIVGKRKERSWKTRRKLPVTCLHVVSERSRFTVWKTSTDLKWLTCQPNDDTLYKFICHDFHLKAEVDST